MDIDPRLNRIRDCLYRVSVNAIIVVDHKILLVKEHDHEWWGLPGGGIEHTETISQALSRELSEELGVDGSTIQSDTDILFATTGEINNGVPIANLFCRARLPLHNATNTEHVIEFRWFTSAEIPKLHLSPTGNEIKARLIELIEE